MNRIRVALADDHPIVLFALRGLLGKEMMVDIVAEVSSPTHLVEHLTGPEPADLVITDYVMPGDTVYGDGIRLIEGLVRHFPATRFVVLTMMSNAPILSALYDAGVMAVVQKSQGLDEVVMALRAVNGGKKYYPPFLKPDRATSLNKSPRERVETLTPKELEVLRHFMSGALMVEVAANLKRSIKTVSSQKMSAMRKLGLDSDQALVEFCIESALFQ